MSDTPLRFGIPLVGGPGWTGGIVYTVNMAQALRSLGTQRPRICAVVSPATADRIPHNRPFLEMCDAVVLHGGFPPSMAPFFEALPPGIEIRPLLEEYCAEHPRLKESLLGPLAEIEA